MPARFIVHCEAHTEAKVDFVSQPQMLRRKPESNCIWLLQVDLQRLMGDWSLGSSPGMAQGMLSMGSAPTPRALMSSSGFVNEQGLQNRQLSDLGSYLELLSLSRGQEQVCPSLMR